LEGKFTDRKVRGSNPTSASRLPLSKLGQPGNIPALVLPSGGMFLPDGSLASFIPVTLLLKNKPQVNSWPPLRLFYSDFGAEYITLFGKRFIPLQQKPHLIRCLTERAMKVCFPDCLKEELKFLGSTFLQNGYPERFVLKTVESVKPKAKQHSPGKRPVYMRLSFKDDLPLYQLLLEGKITAFYHQRLCLLICTLVPSVIRWSYDRAFVGKNAVTQSRISEWSLEETRLKCDRITFGRNQSCHRQRASLHYHIPGTPEPIKIGTIQTTIDRRGDWNPTAGSTTLRPKETCAVPELEQACKKSGPTSLSDIDVTYLIP
ncbi:hypothetical protein CSKR_104920, partial [Clonorchis sinensis]